MFEQKRSKIIVEKLLDNLLKVSILFVDGLAEVVEFDLESQLGFEDLGNAVFTERFCNNFDVHSKSVLRTKNKRSVKTFVHFEQKCPHPRLHNMFN